MACETMQWTEPIGHLGRGGDPLTEHLARIVRRALRRPLAGSRVASAIRAAAERIHLDADRPPDEADEIRVQQVTRRLSALLAPGFRDDAGYAAQRETVYA